MTPSCALDGSPRGEGLLRLTSDCIPTHCEVVHRIQDSFELARVHVAFRFQEPRELARVRFEISLPGFHSSTNSKHPAFAQTPILALETTPLDRSAPPR